LNSDSRLAYPTVFKGKERVVSLEGEAYFKVAKDAAHPFIVKSGNLQIRVLGTEFNVRSYSPTDVRVTLIFCYCGTQYLYYTNVLFLSSCQPEQHRQNRKILPSNTKMILF